MANQDKLLIVNPVLVDDPSNEGAESWRRIGAPILGGEIGSSASGQINGKDMRKMDLATMSFDIWQFL